MSDEPEVGIYLGKRVESLVGFYGQLHVFSGSFDPLLAGHRRLYESIDPDGIVESEYRQGVSAFSSIPSYLAFEISRNRIGRNPYSPTKFMEVLRQFSGYAPVLTTTGPTFADKANLLTRHCHSLVFHVGVQTYDRLLEHDGERNVEAIPASFSVWPRNGRRLQGAHPANCFPAL